ncbi:hypothetical protein [Streptomyces sp. bgisy126]|uniref:hypothetical protein n=1 Tax=unclassified Streptomyces TaxID=2593676 RepID=UPI003EBA03D3
MSTRVAAVAVSHHVCTGTENSTVHPLSPHRLVPGGVSMTGPPGAAHCRCPAVFGPRSCALRLPAGQDPGAGASARCPPRGPV